MKKRQTITALCASAALIAGIATFEGFSDTAYPDPVHGWEVPTIGHGTTTGVKRGDTITKEEAEQRLRADVAEFENDIKRCITVPLTQNEYDAFISLSYNIGTRAFCRSTLVRKLNTGDYEGACKEILRWRYAGGQDCSAPGNRTCSGIWRRRQG